MYIAVCVCDCSPMSIYESRKHELPRVRQQGVAAGKKAQLSPVPHFGTPYRRKSAGTHMLRVS